MRPKSVRSKQQVLLIIVLKIGLVIFINFPTVVTKPAKKIKSESWTCNLFHVNKKKAVPGSCISYQQCNWNSFNDYQMSLHDCPNDRTFDPFFTDCVAVRTSKELTVCPQKTNPKLFQEEVEEPTTVQPMIPEQKASAPGSMPALEPLPPLDPIGTPKKPELQQAQKMPEFPKAPKMPEFKRQSSSKSFLSERRLYHEPFVNKKSIGNRVSRFPF